VLRVGIWAALAGSVLACAGVAALCWLQSSAVGWITNLVALALLLTLVMVYQRPGSRLLRSPFSWVYPLSGVAGALSVVRAGELGWPRVTSTAFGAVVFFGDEDRVTLGFPFCSGRWAVAVGGVTALNHHVTRPDQVGALDLIGVRRDGARAAGVCPTELESYEAYGRQVVSPCDGVVIEMVDGLPDQLPHRAHGAPSGGNLLRIDTGHEVVTLAHLRCHSVKVSVGDQVRAGQPLAEVGSSGRSAEPHLHLHAEREGRGLRLRFTDAPLRRLRPGAVLDANGSLSSG
jgi:peptidase M23-like protein